MNKPRVPRFAEQLVEANLKDGYWIQAVDIDGDGRPDLVASGLALGEVVWYQNPTWKKRRIAKMDKPVAIDAADIAGAGCNDLVISHDYGECMFGCRPQDGKISWLRNPGHPDGEWEVRPIGDLLATHRLRLGQFTQTQDLELLALPVVGPQGKSEGVHSAICVTLFTRPADPLRAGEWPRRVVDESRYRIIHGVVQGKFAGRDLDSVLLASEEGISFLRYERGEWCANFMHQGEVSQHATTGFKGSGNVAIGKLGKDAHAYIATVEPFHGNTVAVYTREKDATLSEGCWKRHVLDHFGDPNDRGEGPGHHVVCADFDGDGDDEFLVALRGPEPWQGIHYYKAVDAEHGLFWRTRVSTASAARITVADFDGDGRPDFATTGYYTPGYFLCDQPRNLVFLNQTE